MPVAILRLPFARVHSFMSKNEFVVFDLSQAKVVKQGLLEVDIEETKQILEGLPNGHYVVWVAFAQRKHSATNSQLGLRIAINRICG